MSLYHNHLLSDRSNSKGKGSSSRKEGKEKAELDRLLHPSYSNASSLARGSMDLGSTYVDAQGNEHDSGYSAYDGLAALNGRRFKGRAIDKDSSTDSDDGQLDTLPSMIGASSMARSTTARSPASHRNRNRPASEMSMHPGIIDGVDYTPGASRRAQAREREKQQQLDQQSSDAGSSSRYPATTTRTSKSRRSTLLSQTTTYTDYPTSEASESNSYLEPPPPSRYSKSTYIKNQPRGGPSYPSPPSSVVSSVTPQIYPETPAQAHQRRSKELARPLSTTKPHQHLPYVPPPPSASAYGGSEKAGNSTGLLERGGYVPSKWKEEKKGRRGAVEEAYRPPDHEEEWTPGCADNLKRSWGEIKLATRFGVFRAKKKLERSVGHGV